MTSYSDLIWGLIFIYTPLFAGFTYGYNFRSREDKNRLLLLGSLVSMAFALVLTLGYLLTERKIYFNAGVNAAAFSIVGMLIGSLDTSSKKSIVPEAAESAYEPPKPESEIAPPSIDEDKESAKIKTSSKDKRKMTKKKPAKKTVKKTRVISKTRKPKTAGKKKAASKKPLKKKPPTP